MILVTGATGRTGRQVVEHLLDAGHGVRLLVRETSLVPEVWRDLERAVGDLDDAASLERAMSGVEGVFLLSPMDPALDRFEANAHAAALRAGVRHVVKMSTTRPEPSSPIPWWRAHWRAEQALRTSGLRWTILRPNGISFFLLDYAASVREHGVIRTAAGSGRMALVDAADIAAVTARVFAEPERHASAVLDLTGPQPVSYGDVAAMLGEITGRAVTHVDVSAEEGRALLSDGRPDWEVEGLVANWLMTRDGSGGFDRVSTDVERVTGHRPRELRLFLSAHAHFFGGTSALRR